MKKIKLYLLITFFSFLLIDFLFGNKIFDSFFFIADKYKNLNEFEKHVKYHHNLKKNLNNELSFYFIKKKPTVETCSDNNSFRISCRFYQVSQKNKSSNNYDLAFMGDSQVYGLGLKYEDTFVGKIANNWNNLKIANFAVSTYSPTIYYVKVKDILQKNIKFKHIVFFPDLTDVWDDSNMYKIVNGNVVDRREKIFIDKFSVKNNSKIRFFLKKNFRLSYEFLHSIKTYQKNRKKIKEETYTHDEYFVNVNSWTYISDEKKFSYPILSLEEGKKLNIHYMGKIIELLKKNDIDFSIGVLPHPQQIMYDIKDNLHVKMWKEFCIEHECKNFINFSTPFFEEIKELGRSDVAKKNFFKNDVHFNKNGALKISKFFLQNFKL